ncbi:exodeoxyribonuclease VII small subunit [Clostridium formicaceticum]|uniref:Exodeoxyribonuclease 7 small subunit n=1 Tax=Clostridium formicaceticum TaxID=1497 RepID=A0AAC9RIA1_9CLOT|nr:exodeoxyribonuclease VII small subunit [Clostridium formicaceticum]AOY77070.1 exodeoxyribonuclease VII small subunit [Clostridium formicaceticum]ARE87576.1 Exodeoxyribonuclease 7 small subunit [Clostridium formicaceticum]
MRKLSYEKALKRLEEVIQQLESKELSLEDSLKLFQEGIDLYRICNTKLNEVEEKIMIIIEENGEIKNIPFTDMEV